MSLNYHEFELEASRTETGNASGGDVDSFEPRFPATGGCRFYLDVTAASVSDTLDVDIIGVVNGKRVVIGSFPQQVAVGTVSIFIEECPKILSSDWTIGGASPSFTFNIQAHRSQKA